MGTAACMRMEKPASCREVQWCKVVQGEMKRWANPSRSGQHRKLPRLNQLGSQKHLDVTVMHHLLVCSWL